MPRCILCGQFAVVQKHERSERMEAVNAPALPAGQKVGLSIEWKRVPDVVNCSPARRRGGRVAEGGGLLNIQSLSVIPTSTRFVGLMPVSRCHEYLCFR